MDHSATPVFHLLPVLFLTIHPLRRETVFVLPVLDFRSLAGFDYFGLFFITLIVSFFFLFFVGFVLLLGTPLWLASWARPLRRGYCHVP